MGETTFDAEIRKVSSKKTASGDVEYQVVLSSEDQNLFTLGTVPGDQIVTVTVQA